MKKVFSKGLIVSSVLLLLISCKKEESTATVADTNQTKIDTNKIKEEIQAKENEFAATYNSGVAKSIGYYDNDAVTYPQNSQPIIGKTAIVEYLKNQKSTKGTVVSFTTKDVFVSTDGGQVVEVGYYILKDSLQGIINSGNYMSLFIKKDGKYYCLRDMSTSNLPNE